jgi:sugar lactone lactonase YvrE
VRVSGSVPQAYSGGIAVDQDKVYWTNYGFNGLGNGLAGTLVQAATTGGSVVTLVSGQNYIINVAASDGGVFWMNQVFDAGNGTSFGSIHGATEDASHQQVLSSGFGLAFNLAVDDKCVYWASSAEGKVFRMNRDGTNVTTLASEQNTPSNVVLDGTDGIYWTNNGTCPSGNGHCTGSVMKLSPR